MNVSRRDFLKSAATTAAGATALSAIATAANADEASAAPVLDQYDLFAESRVVVADIPEDEIAETYDYDYVVIGGGTAGTTSALAAGANGVGKVALLQNAYACISAGQMGSGILLDKSDNLGVARYKQQWNEQNLFRGDQHLLDNLCKYSGEAMRFVYHAATEVGGWEPSALRENVLEYEDGHIATSWCVEYGPKPVSYAEACNSMASVADQFGVDVYFGMPGVKLIQDESGRVIAAIGKSLDDDKYYRFNAAKGVLLACGTFHCNSEMRRRYCTDAVGFDSKVSGYFGDGHLMGMLAGGVMRNGAHSKMVHDNDNPMQSIPFLGVNDNGERFMNEECNNQWVNNILKDQPNPGWWSSIFDANYMEQVTSWGNRPTDEEGMKRYMPGTEENLALGVFAQECHAFKADTLEELAEQLGIPGDNLVKTVERYNELVALGEDLDFGKKTMYMAPIDTPPFWGVHRHQRLSAILSGLNVDKYMRVVDADKNPIPGLYAAGNNAGCTSGNCDWYQVTTGNSLGNAFTGGYVAALHVSGVIGTEE